MYIISYWSYEVLVFLSKLVSALSNAYFLLLTIGRYKVSQIPCMDICIYIHKLKRCVCIFSGNGSLYSSHFLMRFFTYELIHRQVYLHPTKTKIRRGILLFGFFAKWFYYSLLFNTIQYHQIPSNTSILLNTTILFKIL